MNFPVWEVSFGAGLLIALVAILHVFVSHFAVGGGLFLVVTERRARRKGDAAMLGWLKTHSKFFVLVTVVFGAISGVGIWFTIGLIGPTATSNLIHIYVWGWGIEWVFFFLEITSALLYLYGWEKLTPSLHMWYGWIYFVAAYASLVVINGIITFMLTSGSWVDTHRFWNGFFNPTYFPSLVVRTCIAFALAGIYALVTASLQKDAELKGRLVKWSVAWILPPLVLVPFFTWWYIRTIPSELWTSARGAMPTATHFASLAAILSGVTLALALAALVRPAKLRLGFSLVLLLAALVTMGSFEFVREAVRKPYVIQNYLYSNSIYAQTTPGDGGFDVDHINQAGVLQTGRWVETRELTANNQITAGHEIFRVECESCHTLDAYRGLKANLARRQWSRERLAAMLGGLNLMHNGVMPPFAGTDGEREALAAFLSSVGPAPAAQGPADGATVFQRNCSMCHLEQIHDPLFSNLAKEPGAANESLKNLPGLFPLMPDLKLTEEERSALVAWVNARFPNRGAAAGGQ
ncbi:MAG TPA: c-type cytochrome [Candidatus Acidoferrales bacterium]|nr:c-type cytochrome [Candidatus Acidoferrales bacterium]